MKNSKIGKKVYLRSFGWPLVVLLHVDLTFLGWRV